VTNIAEVAILSVLSVLLALANLGLTL
jgi:hypothetical protein